jgi:hypothetical protein
MITNPRNAKSVGRRLSIIDRRMSIAEWPRPRGEILVLRGLRKRCVQRRTPKTPTDDARVTSGGHNL